jgi:hypothetical protein
MGLRAKAPKAIEQRMKALFYGEAGVGKSTAAINFPKPYWIDTERSADKPQYAALVEKQGGVVFQTYDFDELITEVKSLLTEKHEYKTLVIDSLTILYNDLLQKAEDLVGNEFGRHYGEANKKMKHLMNLLLRLDMNVIITSHSKIIYGENLSVKGNTFDCYKKLDYLFDLVFEIQKRGEKRIGLVKKSRYEGFKDLDAFEFSYDEIAKRYGREILEREAVAQILATPEQIAEVERLVELLKVPEEVVAKWLTKAEAMNFGEMQESAIVNVIKLLNSKIKGEAS